MWNANAKGGGGKDAGGLEKNRKISLKYNDVIPLNTEDVSTLSHIFFKNNNLYFIETASLYLKIYHLEKDKF